MFIIQKKIYKGGTGYGDYSVILPHEIEHIYPDYSLYNCKEAMGITTRGCPNKCSFCVVPKKEGDIKASADIHEFWHGQKELILLDNNILAHEHGLQQLEECIRLGISVDCNQGLDARIIAKDVEIQKLLAKVKWSKYIRLACDSQAQMESVRKTIESVRSFTGHTTPFFVYVMIRKTDLDLSYVIPIIEFLKEMKYVDPHVQPEIVFDDPNYVPPKIQKRFARYCNRKACFRSCEWKDYMKPVKNNSQGMLCLWQ